MKNNDQISPLGCLLMIVLTIVYLLYIYGSLMLWSFLQASIDEWDIPIIGWILKNIIALVILGSWGLGFMGMWHLSNKIQNNDD